MKRIFKKPLIWILAVFVLALFFRFYNLVKYPVSLSMDEVAIGVNAYSILKTGNDEHGVHLPLAFESVGDFKPPVNIYLTAVSEFVFGMNEFAVRFPSALIGALSCIVLIFLLKSLKIPWSGSIFGGFWLSILPWHIHFSRGSFEAVTALFFLMCGTWLFVEWIDKKRLLQLILTVISFSLSVWSYHAERLFVPLLVLFLIISYKKKIELKKVEIRKQLFAAGAVLLLFVIPFMKLAIFTPAIAERAAVTSILREQSLVNNLHAGKYTSLKQAVFDNDYFLIFRHWSGKYLDYFDIRFWFWKGLQFTPSGYPDLGLMYPVDILSFVIGIYYLIRSKKHDLQKLALFWFFIGPLPASFTMNIQHPLRALTWIPFFGIVIAGGFQQFLEFTSKKWLIALYVALIMGNIIYFGDIYINQFPRYFSESWQFGYKQISQYVCSQLNNYDKIFVSDTFGSFGPLNTGTPYLYMIFYCPEDMKSFVDTGKSLQKIYFRRPNVDSAKEEGKLLLIGSPWDFLDGNLYGGKIINRVVYPSGIDAFLMVEKNAKN